MQQTKIPLLLGAHISIEGGFDKAIIRGESIGCTAIQIFTKSNRQWFAKSISNQASELFKTTMQQSTIEIVVAHAAYLINIGAPNLEIQKKSTQSLIEELHRCHTLNLPYLILHPGTNNQSDSHKIIAQQLDIALDATPDHTMILLETMAGQGNNTCYRFEQLARIYEYSRHQKRLGICVDTCHIFVAGYDLRIEELYHATWELFDKTLGFNLLKIIHLNDSKKQLGSRIDRHEHIGRGALGESTFRFLMNDQRFFNIPKILETPKDSLRDDWNNMNTLINLITSENKQKFRIDNPSIFVEAKSK